ncbi:MAG: hypothetical protein ACRD0W_05255 [Acidimicrobiales bacterium]
MSRHQTTTDGICRYSGWDKSGRSRGGATSREPAELVEELYGRGWLQLSVTRDGVLVGSIRGAGDHRRRTWWAES